MKDVIYFEFNRNTDLMYLSYYDSKDCIDFDGIYKLDGYSSVAFFIKPKQFIKIYNDNDTVHGLDLIVKKKIMYYIKTKYRTEKIEILKQKIYE